MNKVKHSAASRKAWRTRKRMKEAREMRLYEQMRVLYLANQKLAAQEKWPDYMRHALPLPDFGKVR
jgi:hypothetical protein